MRNGAYLDVCCDGRDCGKRLEVSLDWDDGSQSLDDSDEAVDEKVKAEGWIVTSGDYCSPNCVAKAKSQP